MNRRYFTAEDFPQPPGRGPNGRRFCAAEGCTNEVAKGRRRYCSDECSRSVGEFLHNWRSHVVNQDKGCCRLCGKNVVFQKIAYELDHIVPLAEGGRHNMENLRVLCVPCHAGETAKLAARLAKTRRLKAKGPMKNVQQILLADPERSA